MGVEGDPREGLPSIPIRTLAQNVPDVFNGDISFVDKLLERVLGRLTADASAVAHVVARLSYASL